MDFFATREDLAPVLTAFERAITVKYVRTGRFSGPELQTYASGLDIPDLGLASHRSSVMCDSYLITLQERDVKVRGVVENDGVKRYRVDQLVNPASVVFTPAGLWGDRVLLHGSVGSASDERQSQMLLRRFSSQARKSFHKIRAFWVGPHAEALLDAGTRLVSDERSPREYDLKRED